LLGKEKDAMAGRRPWYEVLGVSPDAPEHEVREAYLALVKRWHPDRFATAPERAFEAEERAKIVNAAYDESRSAVAWEPAYEDAAARYPDAAEWPEWSHAVEPARVRLFFVPGGLAVRVVALLLALVFTFLAVAQAVNALDLVIH
jgi:hypothetical protein